MSLFDEIQTAVDQMDPEQLKAEFAKIKEAEAKRKEKQKQYTASPESKAKRLEYAKKYREANPEKFAAQRKAYMQRPEVKNRMKTYRDERNAKTKAILAKAKELGIA